MLLPIYPTGESQTNGTIGYDLDSDFRLTPQRSLDSDFINALKEREIWWTGHIIIDEYALADVVEFIAGANDNSYLDGVNAITVSQLLETPPMIP
jgi:hypothetical protein